MSFKKQPKGFATSAIHVGQDPEQWNHMSVIPPIVTSTTFKQFSPANVKQFEYGRSGNPTRNVLEKCMAKLDGAKHCLTFASGLGATTTIVQLLNNGDHILSVDDLYGGSNRMFQKIWTRFGVTVDFVDMTILENVEKNIKPTTRMVWVESPTNPTMKVLDIEAICKIVHKHPNIFVCVDNTFLTSYLQRPLELGADLVMYSLTKFMNGHSDVIMGSCCTNSDELHEKLRFLQNASGIIPSPFDCYQVNRSLKTLALRMEQHNKSSLIIAKYLEAHPFVEKVNHPGLASHPQHEIALRQAYGHSGIMSFYIKGGLTEAKKFFQALKIFTLAESLGGYESLAELPSVMTHASVPPEQRVILGITDTLIRVSVGLEDVDDLIEDLENALKASQTE